MNPEIALAQTMSVKPTLAPACDTATPAPLLQDLAGVANNGLDLGLGECPAETRHALPTVAYDGDLVRRIREFLDDLAREPRTRTPATRRTMATAATRPEDVTTEGEDVVGLAVGAQRHGRRVFGTPAEEQHQGETGGEKSPEGGGGPHEADDTDPMGMDPTRPHRRRPSDYLFVGAAILVAVLLVLWAFLG